MSNSLDPDQARRFVGPDLGPNCLPSLSADDTGRQRVKANLESFRIMYYGQCKVAYNSQEKDYFAFSQYLSSVY